jgi:tetratricopeptide (TPR) repeat protein
VDLNPGFAEAHLNLGAALRSVGKEKEAVESIEKALELKPQLAKGYFTLKPLRTAVRR